MPDALNLTAAVVVPYLGAVIAALLPRTARQYESYVAAGAALLALLAIWLAYPEIARGGVARASFPWVPARA